jgi:hypothetical protein
MSPIFRAIIPPALLKGLAEQTISVTAAQFVDKSGSAESTKAIEEPLHQLAAPVYYGCLTR